MSIRNGVLTPPKVLASELSAGIGYLGLAGPGFLLFMGIMLYGAKMTCLIDKEKHA